MKRYKINLVTKSDLVDFTDAMAKVDKPVSLTDGNGFKVSAKSILGVMYTVEWAGTYVETEADIYDMIEKWICE